MERSVAPRRLGDVTDAAIAPVDTVAPDFSAFYGTALTEATRAVALTVGDDALAREAVDEAMVRAYERWAKVGHYANPEGWVYRVAVNWAYSSLRRSARAVLRAGTPDRAVWDTPVDPDLGRALARPGPPSARGPRAPVLPGLHGAGDRRRPARTGGDREEPPPPGPRRPAGPPHQPDRHPREAVMTNIDRTAADASDLAARFRATGQAVPPHPPDLDRLHARAGRRRRRRRVAGAVGSVVVLAAVAGGTVAATIDDTERVTAVTPDDPTTTGEPPAPTTAPTSTTSDVATSEGPTSTTTTTATTEAVGPTDDLPAYMVSEGDTVVWHLPTGPVPVTPVPGVVLRAKAIGDGTAVAVTRGPDQRMFLLAPGDEPVEVEAPLARETSDLWTVGLVDGRRVLVGNRFGGGSDGLVALDLDSGEETEVPLPSGSGGVFQPSMTADGRLLVTSGEHPDCTTTLVDLRTMTAGTTGLTGCGLERAVSPDGTRVVDVSEDFAEVVTYDVATGAEVDRDVPSQPVALEGFQIEYDGRRVVLSNAYDDDLHAPWEVLDTETGAITPLPGRGPASAWLDPDA